MAEEHEAEDAGEEALQASAMRHESRVRRADEAARSSQTLTTRLPNVSTIIHPSQNYLLQIITLNTTQTQKLARVINPQLQACIGGEDPRRRTFTCSTQYRTTLFRMSPLLVFSETRIQTFQTLADELDWNMRTKKSYWGAILTLLKLCNMTISGPERLFTTKLEREERLAPTWELTDCTQFLTAQEIRVLTAAIPNYNINHPMRGAWITLMLGQRCGDILQLSRTELKILGELLTIHFVSTKTSCRTGQFHLTVPLTSEVAQILVAAAQTPRQFLFGEGVPRKDEQEIHIEMMRTLGHSIDIRALRRTGLARIANAGTPLNVVLSISRHTTVKMLERYLNEGLFHGELHSQMVQAFQSAWTHVLPLPSVPWM